ncbi:hypothetical protein CYQ88_10835 [Hydrogenovibrio sp. SC-1]|uniref:hypothetical protein n=1 Tax=Hydrogenovibrio sp. SC-1 TaxID=2065820 RepID=UPI000C7CA3F9|nr:hypothetical protein [Hydrogenovibrio sp. SC-1]PLA73510.1 hypothetical protein CYQ88_10835 [Hydrogenovibrio sp. SC-1]
MVPGLSMGEGSSFEGSSSASMGGDTLGAQTGAGFGSINIGATGNPWLKMQGGNGLNVNTLLLIGGFAAVAYLVIKK